MTLIEVKNLNKIYGSGEAEVKALKNINLNIEQGEFVAIVGQSGSGKSTLLHLIGGVDIPSSGEVIIDGKNIYKLKEKELSILRRRKLGFIFQFFNLIPVLTAQENIEMPVLLDNEKIDKKYMNELLRILGLEERKNNYPSQLSGGQQQRVSIGRALANKPSIILADEPTGNLDSKNSKEVLELLKYCAKKYNQTLILITHDINIAKSADRVITIEDGEITSDEVIKYGFTISNKIYWQPFVIGFLINLFVVLIASLIPLNKLKNMNLVETIRHVE